MADGHALVIMARSITSSKSNHKSLMISTGFAQRSISNLLPGKYSAYFSERTSKRLCHTKVYLWKYRYMSRKLAETLEFVCNLSADDLSQTYFPNKNINILYIFEKRIGMAMLHSLCKTTLRFVKYGPYYII